MQYVKNMEKKMFHSCGCHCYELSVYGLYPESVSDIIAKLSLFFQHLESVKKTKEIGISWDFVMGPSSIRRNYISSASFLDQKKKRVYLFNVFCFDCWVHQIAK